MKPAPSPAAEKQRRYRRRRKEGVKVLRLEISGDEMDALSAAGLVVWNEDDPEMIAEAIRLAIKALRGNGGRIGMWYSRPAFTRCPGGET